MRRLLALLLAVLVLGAGCGGSGGKASSSSTSTSTPPLVSIGAGLRGPPGLRATVYAHGPGKTAAFAVDPQNRLWVATADYTDQGKDGVYVVATAGATPVEVIAGLHTPLGLLWYQSSLYITSKERVDAYSGFDGSRFAATRTVLTLPAGVGQSNELVLGPEGRMLLGISAPCDHCTPTSPRSASIVSFRPEGSDLQTYASGIRAPIGLAYFPGTNDLFVTMNQRDDLGARTPGDWLAQVHQGDAWGFPRCYGQGGTACHGVPAPTAVLDKHAAVSGLAIVAGQLGSAVGTSAIVAEWAVGKVLRVALRRAGSTYTASVRPFLTGLKNPVAVLLTADGALLVGDWTTGIIYRVSRRSE